MKAKSKTTAKTGKVSTRKRAAYSISYLASLLDTISDAWICTDLDFNVLEWNAAAESMYGWKAAEVIGHPLGEFVQIEYEGTTREAALKTVVEEGSWKGKITQSRKDGTRFPVMASISLAKDETDKSIGFVFLNRDITERRQMEESLRWSEAKFSILFNEAPYAAQLANLSDGRIVEVNEAFETLMGYSRDEAVGKSSVELKILPEPETRARMIAEFGARDFVRNVETTLRTKSGDLRTFLVNSDIIKIAGEKHILTTAQDITERKQAEERLTLSETRYRRLFESAKDGILILDAETGMIMDVNPFLIALLGYSKEDFLSKNIWELGFFKDILASKANFLELQQRGYVRYEDLPLETASGQRVNVEFVSNVYEAGHQKVIQCNIRDITKRKLTEEALAESEAKYRTLVESAEDAILLTDLTGKHIFANSAYYNSLGYGVDEDPNQDGLSIVHPDDLPVIQARMPELFERGALATEYRVRHRSGRWLYRSSKSVLIKDHHGKPKSILAIIRDITEHKKAEAKIRQQLEHLKSLRAIDTAITSSFDIHLTLDIVLQQVLSQLGVDAAAILLVNPQSQTIEYAASLGFRSNVLHHTQLKLNEGYAGRAVREHRTIHIPDLLATGGKLAEVMQLAGEDFVDYYGRPLIVKEEIKGVLEIYHRSILDPDSEWLDFLESLAGQGAVAIDNAQLFEHLQRSNTELEERVARRTEELNELNTELEHANRTKDEFLANMSHELRTPLNSILGLSETLLEQRRDPISEYQQRSLEIIQSSGTHLLELINDILDLSKIEAGKFDYYPQIISVGELCRSSLTFVKELAIRKSITVSYVDETPVSKVYADPRRLKQILVNLLSNAVKFTPERGQVALRVLTDTEQDRIQFSVIDNGIGIALEHLRQLFVPFKQVDSSYTRDHEGTGLGLALVQKLTELHGGSVDVQSEIGKGSRFTITLPLWQTMIAQQEGQQNDDERLPGKQVLNSDTAAEEGLGQGIILLAEDNPANIMTLTDYLESHGYQVVVAHDGFDAIAKAEEIQPNIILMDIQMPVLDGLGAIRRLRMMPRFASTPIVALTALAMPGDRERCIEAGANEYMSKPVSLKLLTKTMEKLRNQSE